MYFAFNSQCLELRYLLFIPFSKNVHFPSLHLETCMQIGRSFMIDHAIPKYLGSVSLRQSEKLRKLFHLPFSIERILQGGISEGIYIWDGEIDAIE